MYLYKLILKFISGDLKSYFLIWDLGNLNTIGIFFNLFEFCLSFYLIWFGLGGL